MPTPLRNIALFQDAYNVISLNYAVLMGRCTTADQQQQLRDGKNAAQQNLIDAQTAVFGGDDGQLDALQRQGQEAMHDINAAIAHIADIVTVLQAVDKALSIASHIFALSASCSHHSLCLSTASKQ